MKKNEENSRAVGDATELLPKCGFVGVRGSCFFKHSRFTSYFRIPAQKSWQVTISGHPYSFGSFYKHWEEPVGSGAKSSSEPERWFGGGCLYLELCRQPFPKIKTHALE